MKCLAAFLGLAALWGAAEAASDHPVTKVVALLDGLKTKAIGEGQEEELTYAKFQSWCVNSLKEVDRAITEGQENIAALSDKIEGLEKEETLLGEQIKNLGDEILEHGVADGEAVKARAAAAALYTQADGDYTSTIAAFGEAIEALEGAKTATATLLAKRKVMGLSQMALVLESVAEDKQALLANPEMPEAMGDLNKHTKKYEFKAGNVIELLKQLKQKFEEDKVEGTKSETAATNAYDLSKAARDDAVAAATAAKGLKEERLGSVEGDLGQAVADLKTGKDDLEADQGTHGATEKSCRMRSSEWEERTKIRTGEIKAIEAAIGILEKVTGVRHEAPVTPAMPVSPNADVLVQLPAFISISSGAVDPKQKAVNLLRTEAQKLHSKSFQRFAEQVAARMSGPFDDVNNMIQKMIFRLMAEQKDEDDHKNWCDLEIEKTNTSKLSKVEKIEDLDAKLDDAKATVSLLTTAITEASEMVSDLTKFMKEATEVRTVGKEENALAIKDSRQAQDAISQAISVLEQFYKESGAVTKEAWEFVQQPVELPAEPSTWGASYTGVSDPANQPDGIITVLKETSASFASMEADTMAQEETDQRNYQEEMKETDIEKARRGKEAEMKEQEKKRLGDKITAMEKSHKHVSGELDAVKQYETDLAPACLDGDSTYEDRKGARTQEIDSLKEAQGILAKAFEEKEPPVANLQTKAFLAPAKVHA